MLYLIYCPVNLDFSLYDNLIYEIRKARNELQIDRAKQSNKFNQYLFYFYL